MRKNSQKNQINGPIKKAQTGLDRPKPNCFNWSGLVQFLASIRSGPVLNILGPKVLVWSKSHLNGPVYQTVHTPSSIRTSVAFPLLNFSLIVKKNRFKGVFSKRKKMVFRTLSQTLYSCEVVDSLQFIKRNSYVISLL